MAWYNKNTTPEWKIFIDKPYTIEGLLMNKQILVKEVAGQKQIQEYLRNNRDNIVKEGLEYTLEFPKSNDSYDRKYLYPTKAIEFMTNQQLFSHLGWDQHLIQLYVHLLLQYFLAIDPHIDNINLYHAYFQRLLKMLLKTIRQQRGAIVNAFAEEQIKTKFIHQLMKHSHKYAVICCMQELLIMDLVDGRHVVSLEFKMAILDEILMGLEQADIDYEVEKIQNSLQLLKMFLEQSIKFLLNNAVEDQRSLNFVQLYMRFTKRFDSMMSLLKKGQTCIKMAVMQVLQLNQILLIRVRNLNINYKWCNAYRSDIIEYVMSLKVGIIYPLFLEFLIILFSDIGQNSDKLGIFLKSKLLDRLYCLFSTHKSNNILSARIMELFKVIYMNLEKQIILNIEKNKNVDISQIKFPLFDQFFTVLPQIQKSIKELKSYNQSLFSHLVRIYKVFNQYAPNIASILNYYNVIEVCRTRKDQIQSVIEFYQHQDCFKLNEQQLSKQLGSFFGDEIFDSLGQTEFSVIRAAKEVAKYNPMNLSIVPEKEQQNKVEHLAAVMQNSVIEIKLNNDLIIKPQQEEGETKIKKDRSPECKEGNTEQSYQIYKNQQMKEAERVLAQRRAKSRTPTKGARMKNEVKKSRSKWTQNQQDQNQENKASSTEVGKGIKNKISPRKPIFPKKENTLKISLIKLSNRRIPKITTERMLDQIRDNRLIGWLKLARETR